MDVAYRNMCNDFSTADLLPTRFKSLMYSSAKRFGILGLSQPHDDAGSLKIAGRCHNEEDAIGQLARKDYGRMLQCCATRVRGWRSGPGRGQGYLITDFCGSRRGFC